MKQIVLLSAAVLQLMVGCAFGDLSSEDLERMKLDVTRFSDGPLLFNGNADKVLKVAFKFEWSASSSGKKTVKGLGSAFNLIYHTYRVGDKVNSVPYVVTRETYRLELAPKELKRLSVPAPPVVPGYVFYFRGPRISTVSRVR